MTKRNTPEISLVAPCLDGLSFVLLVPAGLDSSLLNHPQFSEACESGFGDFWNEYENQSSLMIWKTCITHFVKNNVDYPYELDATPLPWTAGYIFGWLSGVASYVDRSLALPEFALASHLLGQLFAVRHHFSPLLQRHGLALDASGKTLTCQAQTLEEEGFDQGNTEEEVA